LELCPHVLDSGILSTARLKSAVKIRVLDYRDIGGTFDHVVSVGMIKHAGYKNYRRYMELIHKVLKDDGFFRLHTIGNNRSEISGDIWVDKYIFPNSMLRSIQEIGPRWKAFIVVEDLHNFGTHYDNTLCAWLSNFDKKNWHDLR
jgi:cyclopropane-fatty-acyl-phospholipid synthase